MSIPEITVQELKAMQDKGESPLLIDVREPQEREIASLEGTLIPLQQLPEHLDELEAHRDDDLIVVYCRSGNRSARAVDYLRAFGFDNVKNLKGGILAWSQEIDPSMPTY